MKIRIKYRVHGVTEAVLQPGQVVEMEVDKALDLIKQGVAEELDGDSPRSSADEDRGEGSAALVTNLRVALAAKEADREAIEKEVFALRDEKAALEKQVDGLTEALKKGRDKGKPSSGPVETAKPQGAA